MTSLAPSALGRGVVVIGTDSVPAAWASLDPHVISDATIASPAAVVASLHRAWLGRRPVVIRLTVDPKVLREPETWSEEAYSLTPHLDLFRERLNFLVFTNNYCLYPGGRLVWMWTELAAQQHGAKRVSSGPGDVLNRDGQPAWIDGGPRQQLDRADTVLPVIHWETVETGGLAVGPDPVDSASELAPDQAAAVNHKGGPARVIAPAGSGKTRVLTERLRHLLVDRRYETGKVIAVAYNRLAQEVMEERTASFSAEVRTINSLGFEILKEARGALKVYDERDVRNLLSKLLPDLQRQTNADPIKPYVTALGRVRLGMRTPTAVEESAPDELRGFAAAFPKFRQELRRAAATDFDEMIYGSVEALLQDPAFRKGWQLRCRHLLVDEFQDLRPIHVLLFRLLAAPAMDVFGVGDDDQVLYGHDGASPDFLIKYQDYFPGAAKYALEVNYRCPVAIVDAARHLLENNRTRIQKEIRSAADAPPSAEALRLVEHRSSAGSYELLGNVEDWLARDATQTSDIAVLTRTNALLLAPQVALLDAGYTVNSTLDSTLLGRMGVRAALAYLRLAVAGNSMVCDDLQIVYNRPSRRLPKTIVKLLEQNDTWGVADLRHLELEDKHLDNLDGLIRDLRVLQKATKDGESAPQLLARVRKDIGLGRAMEGLDKHHDGDMTSHVDDLLSLEQAAILHPEPRTFEPWLRGLLEASSDPHGVRLSTIHRVKGQEWDWVCVYGANDGLMPHRLAGEEIEEERRIMHVAITRGRRGVVVLAEAGKASPFFNEMRGIQAPRRGPPPGAHVPPHGGAARPSPIRPTPAPMAMGIRPSVGDTLTLQGGYTGRVFSIDSHGVMVQMGNGRLVLAKWGERVECGGSPGHLRR